MIAKVMQRVWLFIHRHCFCWHDWKVLKWYGLPNEPVLAQCVKCRWITSAIL